MNKSTVYISASIFGAVGAFLGSLFDGQNLLGLGSIIGGVVGGLAGIWLVVKFFQ